MAGIDERLELYADSSTWTANLRVESRAAPFFEYDCIIDPGVQINSVSVERDGADRLLRWSQEQSRLKIFIEGDQPGTHNVQISGTFQTSPRSVFQCPRFDVSDVKIESRVLRLNNHAGVALRWDAVGQDAAQLLPGAEISLETDSEGQGVPTNLQFDPERHRVQIAQSIWLMPVEQNAWTVWQRLVITNSSETFPRQTIRIPEEWEHVSAQASGGEVVHGTDSEGEFIELHDADGDTVELNLLTRLVHADELIPLARAEHIDSTTLLLPRSVAINSNEWLEEASAAVDTAPEGFSIVGEWAAYRPRMAGAALPMLPDPGAISGLQVLYAETDVYVSADAIVGETRYDISVGSLGALALQQPAHSSIQSVAVDGVLTAWDAKSLIVPIPRDRRCVLVAITWFAHPSGNRDPCPLEELIPFPEFDSGIAHLICCWNQGAASIWLPNSSNRIELDELWLARWRGLYQVADRSGAEATNDRLLQWRIAQCETALDSPSGSGTPDSGAVVPTLRSVNELRDRWDMLTQSWPPVDEVELSIAGPVESPPPSWDVTMHDIKESENYRVTFGDDVAATTPIPSTNAPWRRMIVGAALTLLLVIVGVWGLRRTARMAWNDRFARHPQLAWTLLGIVWWLCLSPSIIGIVILVLVATQLIYRQVGWWHARSRRSAIHSTFSR